MQEVESVYQDAYSRTNCLKGLFIHDISNLFQTISNSIELCESLLKEEVNTGDIIDFFQMIVQQLNQGKKLIRKFRNLSELGENQGSLALVEVFSELRNAINSAYVSFPKKNIDIKVKSAHKNLYIMANELLSEIFENIITNSIKYNKKKVVQIEVLISVIYIHYKNCVKIEFKDNGIGIDDSRKETIFKETHSKSGYSKGMGIGLSLVAKLIKLYGGDIWVENRIKRDSSKGSNFIIIIPLVK